jgi:hypothetical protein
LQGRFTTPQDAGPPLELPAAAFAHLRTEAAVVDPIGHAIVDDKASTKTRRRRLESADSRRDDAEVRIIADRLAREAKPGHHRPTRRGASTVMLVIRPGLASEIQVGEHLAGSAAPAGSNTIVIRPRLPGRTESASELHEDRALLRLGELSWRCAAVIIWAGPAKNPRALLAFHVDHGHWVFTRSVVRDPEKRDGLALDIADG